MGVVGRLALGSVGPLLSKRAKRSTEPVAPTHRPAVKHREFWSATNFYQRVTLAPHSPSHPCLASFTAAPPPKATAPPPGLPPFLIAP